jgi:hypothetical protein
MADATTWPKLPCKWTHDEDDGSWATDCGEAFCFTDEGPKENGMHFCCYCGGELIPCRKPDCPVCEGRGYDSDDNTCMACLGTGKDDEAKPIAGVEGRKP